MEFGKFFSRWFRRLSKLAFPFVVLFLLFIFTCMRLPDPFGTWEAVPENLVSYYFANADRCRWSQFLDDPNPACMDWDILKRSLINLNNYKQGETMELIARGCFLCIYSAKVDPARLMEERVFRHYYPFAPGILVSTNMFGVMWHQQNFNRLFCIAVVLSMSLALTGRYWNSPVRWYVGMISWLVFLLICTPIFSYRFHYDKKLYHILREHRNECRELVTKPVPFAVSKMPFLESLPTACDFLDTGKIHWNVFVPLRRQDENVHQGRAFLGTGPDGKFRYVRISDTFLTHFYFVPEGGEADLKAFHPNMTFQKLDDDFFVGSYEGPIGMLKRFLLIYVISAVLFAAIIVWTFDPVRKRVRAAFARLRNRESRCGDDVI